MTGLMDGLGWTETWIQPHAVTRLEPGGSGWGGGRVPKVAGVALVERDGGQRVRPSTVPQQGWGVLCRRKCYPNNDGPTSERIHGILILTPC